MLRNQAWQSSALDPLSVPRSLPAQIALTDDQQTAVSRLS
jgi:hypothetical protein